MTYTQIKNTNYEVSLCGSVRRISDKKIMKACPNNSGYLIVSVGNLGKQFVHRVVALVFITNPNNLPQVNHIDGNKNNNHASNLEWISKKDNIKHAIKLGLYDNARKTQSKAISGENHYSTKLSPAIVLAIRREHKKHKSIKKVADYFGLKKSCVADICYRRSWINLKDE